jgi:hypothetical protein
MQHMPHLIQSDFCFGCHFHARLWLQGMAVNDLEAQGQASALFWTGQRQQSLPQAITPLA